MKTKRALSAFVAAFVLSACGSKTEAPAPAADTTPPAAAPAADAAASAANHAFAFPLTRLACPWRKPYKGSDLTAIQGSKLRQIGKQRAGNVRTNPWNRLEEIFLSPPKRRAAHRIINIDLDRTQFFLQSS